MSEATKLSEYLGFEVAYHDGFAYIQEEGTNGVEIKRDASLEERTLWTELKHVSDELAALKAAQGVPDGWKHDCAVLLANDVELWIGTCPHCGKSRPHPAKQAEPQPLSESAVLALYQKYGTSRLDGFTAAIRDAEAAHGIFAEPAQAIKE